MFLPQTYNMDVLRSLIYLSDNIKSLKIHLFEDKSKHNFRHGLHQGRGLENRVVNICSN